MNETRTYDQDSATLRVRTGVAGRSARLGHRLILEAKAWRAEAVVEDGVPTALTVVVEAASLDVVASDGGLTSLSAPERAVARTNAHKSLKVKAFPEIEYRSTSIEQTANGFHVQGGVTLCGQTRPCGFALDYEDAVPAPALVAVVPVRQTDFGIKPFSLMMGTLSVADEVTVEARAIP
ncbi:YceI family protein [Tsukamurella sp. 1534]|uniref:YceI family protein n=1 Tax=Tsukamurella sp. 1534 TaxID=1151061 RepID=UPI0002D54945|nr:YceI family protein [Tsukamurella sp. 1534]